MAGALTVDIVGPDRILWSGTAERVIAPSVEGEIGLLANHEPILSLLRSGTVRVRGESGDWSEFPIKSGFVSFDHNIVNIVAEPADTHED
ncbi:F0F1 ATP synthase subunit epsilon [Demequina aestuarii]|uniref:F0F1 ATP synthase subunit epsilon n=1 Tax=Demequina aestuarii TaxID=327095 RepID=UPI0007856D09|nr:F0F1 ATP synthase subunit epsilon [Demequina aestuarii]